MRKEWFTAIMAAAAVALIPAVVQASEAGNQAVDWRNYLTQTRDDWHPDKNIGVTRRIGASQTVSAPEVDSASAAAALTLLAGALLMLRNRRTGRTTTF